jgi:hypothetical protein
MSVFPSSPPAAPIQEGSALFPRTLTAQDVVEIGLLLPADWAVVLIELSKKRQQSVGQMLRSAIERTFIHIDV